MNESNFKYKTQQVGNGKAEGASEKENRHTTIDDTGSGIDLKCTKWNVHSLALQHCQCYACIRCICLGSGW